jgi:membrane fusion protein, heavy metal efflux system
MRSHPGAPRPARASLVIPAVLLAAVALVVAACGAPDASAVCADHGVTEAACPFCHPELIASLGECAGHGGAEATCFACRPWLEPAFRATNDWCAGHDRPESQCYLCNPELDPLAARAAAPPPATAIRLERTEVTLAPGATDESRPRSRRSPSTHCTKQDMRVRFADATIAGRIGLEYAAAERRRVTTGLTSLARIEYDRDRFARLSSQADAVVERVTCEPGEPVERGRTLVVLSSADIAEAKAEYLRARADLALRERDRGRVGELAARELATERDLLEADTALSLGRIQASHARDQLLRTGFTDAQVEEIARSGDAGPRLALVAPFDGVVVELEVAAGEVVEAARPVLAVADVSRMWARLEAPETAVPLLRPGQPVTVEVDALPGEVFGGRLSWVSTAVDPVTRTICWTRSPTPRPCRCRSTRSRRR